MMLQGTGSSIYVFIAVVAVFLIGIAGGSLIYERQRDRGPQMATLGALLAVAAGLALVPMIISNCTGRAGCHSWSCSSSRHHDLRVYLPAHGAAVRRHRRPGQPGCRVVYAVNTAGCVAGTVLAGFVLIPGLGASASIIMAGLVLAVLGGALAIGSAPRRETVLPATPDGRGCARRSASRRRWHCWRCSSSRPSGRRTPSARSPLPASLPRISRTAWPRWMPPVARHPQRNLLRQRHGHYIADDHYQGAGLRGEGRPAECHLDAQYLLRDGRDVPVLPHSWPAHHRGRTRPDRAVANAVVLLGCQ